MKIAIGTLREPKIAGIKEGISRCPYLSTVFENIEYILENVSSDISHMPTSVEEVVLGAKNRADNLVKRDIKADYYIGIEGGTTRFGDKAYLFGCVYIMNTLREGHYGFSPAVEVPLAIDRMLYVEKRELGTVMGELSGKVDIRSENGSMGAWTDDMLVRKDEFAVAFQAAIAPFFNEYYKLN